MTRERPTPLRGPSRRQFLHARRCRRRRADPRRAARGLRRASDRPRSRPCRGALTLAAPIDPVTWPIAAGNEPIADNLDAGDAARRCGCTTTPTTSVRASIKSFEKKYAKYDVKVTVSTFNDTDEAITKIRTGAVPVRHLLPQLRPDQPAGRRRADPPAQPQLHHEHRQRVGRVPEPLVRPATGATPSRTPSTRPGSAGAPTRCPPTSPRSTNPYDTLWNSTYRGETAIIDDWHTAMAMCLLRAGRTDINTARPPTSTIIDAAADRARSKATDPKVTITMYNDLPGGQLGQCQMWSGDVVNAQYYLPKGTSPSTCCATGSPRTARAWSTTT